MNIDWVNEFGSSINDNDIDGTWNKFKTILQKGTSLFVSNNCDFLTWTKKRWKRPVNKETRTSIKLKRKAWKKFLKSKDVQDLKNYKEARNVVRKQTRNINKEEQNQITKDCKSNPKKFWNYIKSKTNSHVDIGDLSYTNDDGEEVQITEDIDKAKHKKSKSLLEYQQNLVPF